VALAVARAPGGVLRHLYGPTNKALAALSTDQAAALKADMAEVARSFDVSDDDTLVLRQDYLEAVIRKPATS
jgi:hypothetical protein